MCDQWPGEPVYQKAAEDDLGIHGGLSGKENDGDKQSREYAVAYSIGGVVGVLHKWMKEGFESPPEMVAGFISNVFFEWNEGYFVITDEVRSG